jgi:ribosomal protein S1
VTLTDFRERKEGLVHISQLSKEGKVKAASDVVKQNQMVSFVFCLFPPTLFFYD